MTNKPLKLRFTAPDKEKTKGFRENRDYNIGFKLKGSLKVRFPSLTVKSFKGIIPVITIRNSQMHQ